MIFSMHREETIPKRISPVCSVMMNNTLYLVQLLEGEYRAVNDVYNKITNDKRHEKMTLLYYTSIDSRFFPEWTMGYIQKEQYINELIRKYLDETAILR